MSDNTLKVTYRRARRVHRLRRVLGDKIWRTGSARLWRNTGQKATSPRGGRLNRWVTAWGMQKRDARWGSSTWRKPC